MAIEPPSLVESAAGGRSIRWRAAAFASGLVAVVLTAFIWLVVRQVEGDLIGAGEGRAATLATLLAAQTGATTAQGLTRIAEFARDGVLEAALVSPSSESRARAVEHLRTMGPAGQDQVIALFDANRREVARVVVDVTGSANLIRVPTVLPAVGPGALGVVSGHLYTQTVVDVRAAAPAQPTIIGYLLVSRMLRPTAANSLSGIVGNGGRVLVGNQSPPVVWTDLTRAVAAPAFDVTDSGPREFRDATGERLIGASANIAGTPWVLLVELRRDLVVAPARQLLRQLLMAGLGFLVVTVVVSAVLSARVTRPLRTLTDAARAIASGDYTRRVPASRRDEIGQLSQAFNLMASRVEHARSELETHTAEIDAARQAADRATRVKDEFLAALSHELRTPLNAMLGWCQMLRTGAVPADRRSHALDVIERNALAQLRLVEDLLDVSRIVAGKFRLETQPLEITDVVAAAVESIQPIADARYISLESDISPASGIVDGDPGRLQQAVANLLSNAIKFTPRGGRVCVSVRRLDAGVEIAVNDNGMGIEPDALPVIFDRLDQGGSAVARQHGGLGLGLAIVRQVVELHHGVVSADSAGSGKGATFRITLPVMARTRLDARPPLRVLDSGSAAVSVRGLRILAVEDADDARQLLEDFLTSQGAAVTAVGSAEAALEWLSGHQPDVIISDIEMPVQNGLDLMRSIRSRESGLAPTPAIALTAYGSVEDRERSRASGFQVHLTKPVDLDELVATVAALCPPTRQATAVQSGSV